MTATASSLLLLSLVKHSAIWERRWFQVIAAGRRFPGEWSEVRSTGPDPTFQLAAEDTVETVVADLSRADRSVAGDLGQLGS